MKSGRKKKVLSYKELLSLALDIVWLVSVAYDDRVPDSSGRSSIRRKVQVLIEGLSSEEVWKFTLLVRAFAWSKKLRPGKVRDALHLDRVSSTVSLDIPEHDGSDRTRLDTLSESEDATCRVVHQCDQDILRRAIWDRALRAGLSGDECRLLSVLLERDWDLCDVIREGFSVKKTKKCGSIVERKLSRERIRMMYSMVLRKLRCSELEDMYEASRRDS